MKLRTKILLGAAAIVAIGLPAFYVGWCNHVEINEVGITYNSITGDVTTQSHPGWYITSPFTKVVTFSTLPHMVTLSTPANVVNRKLVRFRPEGALDFIRLQGFSYNNKMNFDNILLGYAYSGKQYTFLEVIDQ